jgi:hypothetical protein
MPIFTSYSIKRNFAAEKYFAATPRLLHAEKNTDWGM